jgi:hypothetical protein
VQHGGVTRYSGTNDFRKAEFIHLDMSHAAFRDVVLVGARMRGVLLLDADIDGAVAGLTINGVEVAPLIDAELDRRHPERTKLRPASAVGAREAWTVIESMWAPTLASVSKLSEADLHRSVDGEWSLVETLRHLVFVSDAWFSHAVLGETRPFHPIALPPSFIADATPYGVDVAAKPTFGEVLAVRTERAAKMREFLATATAEDLHRVRPANTSPGYPPSEPRTAMSCLHILFNEEWAHHRFAVRDLAVLDGSRT